VSLSERLREVARGIYHPSLWDDLSEAATTIDTQAAEIKRLRASLAEAVRVLGPFANLLPDAQSPRDALQARLQVWCRAARDFITKHGGGS
jgi:hypothetical protein